MPSFVRGLFPSDADFLVKLSRTSLWQLIVADKDLFWAIRRDSINVYYQGCSLFRFSYKAPNILCETHYKYLLGPSLPQPYARWSSASEDAQLDADSLQRLRNEA